MNGRKKSVYSIVSIILVILMAFLLPIQVFAETTPEPTTEDSVTFDSLAEAETNANIVTELKNRRDKYTKHFRMDDGTITAVTYDFPVHYKNKNGKWIEYDNSLIGETSSTPDEAKIDSYTNKKSDINIELSADGNASDLVKITSKKGDISWKYINTKDCDVKINNSKKQHKGNAKFTSIDKLTSISKYEDIYQNVDLACIVSSTGVKENIILNNANVKNEFEIEYDIQGLQAKKTDNNTIQIQKKGKTVYTISAPLMYDAKGTQSTDLTLNVLSNNNGKLRVKLESDKDFLTSSETVYPVTIDPEVSFYGYQTTESVSVNENSPDTNYSTNSVLFIGTDGSDKYKSLIKCKNIEQTYMNKQIVSAKLQMSQAVLNEDICIDVCSVNSEWTTNSATYNNVSVDTSIIDYFSYPAGRTKPICFDITKVFKKWVEQNTDNNGVCLTTNGSKMIFGNHYAYLDCFKPTFFVRYKEYTGLESNLTSHTIPCGMDANISVCDYTGSMTVKQTFYEENAKRLPLNIYGVYNTSRNTYDETGGSGWHYSFNQIISEDTEYYVYTDADGVKHYFKKESGAEELEDEDELGYTLKIQSDCLEIDDGSVTQRYEIVNESDIYKLKLETDNDNNINTIVYTYNNAGYLTTITTSLGDYTISRTSDHLISSIQMPNSKQMSFVYLEGTSKIQRFTANDGKSSKFLYTDDDNSLLEEVRYYQSQTNMSNEAYGSKVKCTYNSDNTVSTIREFGWHGAPKNYLSFVYNDDNTTVITDQMGNSETYTFDNYGKTVTVLNSNGMITNASDSGSLNIGTGSDSYTKNYIAESNEPQGLDGGHKFNSGESTDSSGGVVSIDDETAYLGQKSIKIEHSVSSATYTFAKQEIYGFDFREKYVTFSAYVKPNGLTEGNQSCESGAMLKLVCKKANGNFLAKEDSAIILSTPNETGWERLSVTAYVPSQTTFIDAYLVLNNAQGSVYFDCMQLEKGKVMNDYNALENSDFSSLTNWLDQDGNSISASDENVRIEGAGGEPVIDTEDEEGKSTSEESSEETAATYTTLETETVENDIVEETDAYGNATKTQQGFVTRTCTRTYESIDPTEEIIEETTEEATSEDSSESNPATSGESANSETTANPERLIYQEVAINKTNVVFNISGTAKADSVPLNNEYRTFGIALKIKYWDDSDFSEDHYQEFNAYTDIFQNVSLSVTPNEDKKVESVEFAFVYGYNKNKMIVKNAMLNYTCYDKAETSEASSSEESSSESSSSEASASESTASSESEDNRVLIDEEVTSEAVDANQLHIHTSSAYDETGNYVVSEIDEAGNSESYAYDNSGNVTQVTDGRGNSTSYSYDVHNNLLSVESGDSSNTYTYDSLNQLASIEHNNFSYNYTYDPHGNPQSVKVGDTPLVTYSYWSGVALAQTQYGNGDKLKYTYDDCYRIKKIEDKNDNTLAEYVYNKKGLVTSFFDGKSNETTEYVYDCLGNTMSVLVVSESGTLLKQLTGDIEKTKINGSEYSIENGTDENDKDYVDYGGTRITTSTDNFGRKESVTSSGYELSYTYKNGSASNSTTKLVDTMTYELDNNDIALYQYTYDANGNITRVEENGSFAAGYIYDSHNQLHSVNDRTRKLYTIYFYDDSGNITRQRIQNLHPLYDYPIGEPEIIDYTYGDSEWKDKLTSYNGQSITYDAIGNPHNYRDGMSMTWQNGRELASIEKNNTTYSFKYNLNGLRTEKNIGGTKTYYYYDSNNNLVGMKKGSNTVLYYYDSDGSLVSMSVGGSSYLFIKNLQGDITKIVDDSGDVVATYAYDAWGKILAETEDSSIAGLNPFRYRAYVYDPETELYYLQSRYYDPLTGRFLNADSPDYTDTGSGSPLSTNMFAYCENNAISGYDPSGKDAYWLQDKNAVRFAGIIGPFGHTSLLLQDSKKKWWYFYWGDYDIQLLYVGANKSKKGLNNFLHGKKIKRGKDKGKYYNKWHYDFYKGDNYTHKKLIKGDFDCCLDYIYYYLMNRPKHLKIVSYSFAYNYSKYINKNYDLTKNNCVIVSMRVLLRGNITKRIRKDLKRIYKDYAFKFIPNFVYDLTVKCKLFS